ncbi:30S ribosomal protein S15 [Candidatus Woesearchaeota archaeon]|nr:30S ribosomal protein S15 [Candidatus Woesearchaeota archaeon]
MARMYSRKKGKSGSKKPIKKVAPSWSRYKDKEVEMLIAKLAKEGKSPSQIGLILRDVYGVPSVRIICKRKINQILVEKKAAPKLPEDLTQLLKKLVNIRKHLTENAKDMPALRGQTLTESKIKRLVKYYKRAKKLPADWNYDSQNIGLLIE